MENVGAKRVAVRSSAWLDVWGGFTAVAKISLVSAPHKKSVSNHGEAESNDEDKCEDADAERIMRRRREENERRLHKAHGPKCGNNEPRER